MSRTQRFALLAVAVVVVVAAFVIARPGEDASSPSGSTATAPGAQAPTQRRAPAQRSQAPLLTAGSVKTVRVKKGDTVRLRARSSTADEVHVHGYDLKKDAPAGKTVRFSFAAKIEGIFEIEFENAGVQIAKLEVTP